jgi:nitroreductase
MDVRTAISARRSIRRFKDESLPEEAIRDILTAGIEAPSGKNRQPWRFTVVGLDKRDEMLRIMKAGIDESEAAGRPTGGARNTMAIMGRAPLTVFITYPQGSFPWQPTDVPGRSREIVDVQSIGAAIQNMCLAATARGIGSLWICDIFAAYESFLAFLGENYPLIAAVSFGYPDEDPPARPRKSYDEVVRVL